MIPKAQATKEKIGKLDFMNFKHFVQPKTLSREKANPENGRKYLQITLSD